MQDDQVKTIDIHIPGWEELPEIALYMDQLLSFINGTSREFSEAVGWAPLTATMVNNYVRAGIVDAPVKKKYSKKSLAMIIAVYILKTCYTTEEISKLIKMGLDFGEPGIVYDRFKEAIEDAVRSVFSGRVDLVHQDTPGGEDKYILGNFALTFACKFYVQREFTRRKDAMGDDNEKPKK